MMKAEKGSEIITTICEYENSVAMPDNERLTYLDPCPPSSAVTPMPVARPRKKGLSR